MSTSTLTIPGKVFVIGEYGALFGGQAVLAALRPGYQYRCELAHVGEALEAELSDKVASDRSGVVPSVTGVEIPIHPASPIGRYLTEREETLSLHLLESSMAQGFGSSTAELIAGVNADLGRLPEIKRLWAWYRDIYPKTSGADLVVQFEAFRTKHSVFLYEHGDATPVALSNVASKIQVFQIDETHKLPTHEALKGEIPALDVKVLNALVKRIQSAFETGTLSEFVALSEFAEILSQAGIESPLAREIRLSFAKIPGVVGVKGCGAGMNDVFLVAGDFSDLTPLLQVARDFKLKALGNLKELLW